MVIGPKYPQIQYPSKSICFSAHAQVQVKLTVLEQLLVTVSNFKKGIQLNFVKDNVYIWPSV